MDYEKLVELIERKISSDPLNKQAYTDFLSACRNMEKTNKKRAHELGRPLREMAKDAMRKTVHESLPATDTEFFHDIYKKSLLFDAPVDLDSYLLYVEMNRPPEKKFYAPRRKVLRPLVQDFQDLVDDKLDFLGVSLPPRVGKSTLGIFVMTWIMGRNPDDANVMSGHSSILTDGFYQEILSIITDDQTYLWKDVFPDVKISGTSAKYTSIDLNRKKRFPTITCRSIEGTLTGAVEIGSKGILYCDDLVKDMDEALSLERLQKKFDDYLNTLKDRKKDGAKEVMVGTRWNVFDPLGRIREAYADNPRYRFTVIPALNEDGESNFQYDFGVGFSTEYYVDMKASIDDATWCAKYQGNPYVREGLLFPADDLNYYNGVLPDGDPVKLATCDVAWGGGDSLSMPFAYIFGDSVYIHDWIFNNGDKTVTRPVVIGRTKQHYPNKEVFEANNGGHEYSGIVDEALLKDGYHINISSKKAPSNQAKMARIIQYSPDIKKFYFLDKKHRSKEYNAAMDELTTFVQTGKNKHDDAADSLAQLANEIYRGSGKVEIFRRPW